MTCSCPPSGLPEHDASPTAPYTAMLRGWMEWTTSSTIRYPGSPLVVLKTLGFEGPHTACLFESDEAASRAVREIIPDRFAVGGSAVSAQPDNPFSSEERSPASIPTVLVDPFGYRPSDPESAFLEGRLTRPALERLLCWTREIAENEGSAVVMVWTHDGIQALLHDLATLGQAFGSAAVIGATILRRRVRTRYHMGILGVGPVGTRVVDEFPKPSVYGTGWDDLPLLRLWGLHRVCVVHKGYACSKDNEVDQE